MSFSRVRVRCLALLALTACMLPVSGALAAPPDKSKKPPVSSPAPSANAVDSELKSAIAAAPTGVQWPNSNYARLLDLGNVTVKSDGTVIAKYRISYKLFNERARDLAEVNLPYNSSYQSLRVLSARTIKKDGTVVEVKPDDIRISSPFHEYLMYDDAQGVGFSMPAIEDDCVIDYTWEEITRPLLMPGQFWTYWGFSGLEPVGISRYVLKAPADKKLNFKAYNDEQLNKPTVTLSTDGKTKTYTWERSNLKPIAIEPGMPRMSEISSWLEVSSLDSWQEVSKWFWGLQSPQAKATPAIKETVNTLIAGKATDDEKARAIYDWVANRTRYVGLEFGLSAYRPHPAADVHDKRYGDCKDKANLLITMLGLAGIKARPVLLHAEERRVVDQGLPTLNAFNHCIALADVSGKEVWLDATAETCAYGDIPYGDRGVQALVVGDNKGEFKTIPGYQPQENGVDIKTNVALNADGSAEAKYEITMRGEAGQGLRATVRQLTPEQRKEMMTKMAQRFSNGGTLKDFTLPDGIDKTGPFVFKMTTTAPTFAEQAGDLLIVPVGVSGNGPQVNPFTQESRVWPVVEEDTSLTRTETTLTLPQGYVAESLPADINLNSTLQEYHRKVTRSADGKSITISNDITERPGRVAPSDYAKLKDYYSSVVKANNQKLVVKKAP